MASNSRGNNEEPPPWRRCRRQDYQGGPYDQPRPKREQERTQKFARTSVEYFLQRRSTANSVKSVRGGKNADRVEMNLLGALRLHFHVILFHSCSSCESNHFVNELPTWTWLENPHRQKNLSKSSPSRFTTPTSAYTLRSLPVF